MKFLHTADLHLDSAFSSSDLFTADKKRVAQRDTLARIFSLAKTEDCQMILIAGDLFDGRYVTPETAALVKKLISEVEIPVIISPGNHDPYVNGCFYKSEGLPENLYIFNSSELQRFDFPELDACVFGYAFTSSALTESPLNGQTAEQSCDIRLLCAHADLSSPISRYCPVTAGDISGLSIDYAALGHIHNRDADDSLGGSTIRYCGFPEGRSFDELGAGGVLIVEIDEDKKVTVSRKQVSAQKYEIRELDLSGFAQRQEIISAIRSEADRAFEGTPTHLRLILTGTIDSDELGDLDSLCEELVSDRILSVEIKNETIPCSSIFELTSDVSLRGEFYRSLYSGLIHSDPAVRRKSALALQIGLAAIDGRRMTEGKD